MSDINNQNQNIQNIPIQYSSIRIIWFDENIYNESNQSYFKKFNSVFNDFKGFNSLDEGFENLYANKEQMFKIILVIVSGKLFGRYVKKIKDNINRIINIPYTFIFTSINFKKIIFEPLFDKDHKLSYDTSISINNGFYNPGGVYDSFEELLNKLIIIYKKMDSIIHIEPRINTKINYEGILTFEYLESEYDLLAPALYKDILTNEGITDEDCKQFHEFILSLDNKELNCLLKNLNLFKNIPYEILSKFWARGYTVESKFYKILNNNLMKSILTPFYKTFIKMLYTGVEINSLKSYNGLYLYRGSVLNRVEINKINSYIKIGKLSNIVVFSKAFLSFTEKKEEALGFIGKSDQNKVGCLYILENNNNYLHESNADIQNISIFPTEKEILFFPGSSFIIKSIRMINDGKIEIILNYNGKFKEKYKFIYDNKQKLNSLIFNNKFTKNIAGKELEFLKGGKYLKGEKIDEFETTFKGKNLETDEMVTIKQIDKKFIDSNSFFNLVFGPISVLTAKIKNSVKIKDYFESQFYYYIIQNIYDDNMEHFMKIYKRISPKLIHKIFKQLNMTIQDLLNNAAFIIVRPSNILIKFSNPEKTNFDSFLSDYWINSQVYQDYQKIQNNQLKELEREFCNMMIFEKFYSNQDLYLYSIGLTMFYFYFGKLPFSEYSVNNFNTLLFDAKNVNVSIQEDKQLENLINRLLRKNEYERISWKEYFNHPFFQQYQY